MAAAAWILCILVLVFNIYVGTAIMQLKDEIRALRRSVNSRSDPYVLDPTRPSDVKVKSTKVMKSEPSTSTKSGDEVKANLARIKAVDLISDEEEDEDEFN